ncbi:MAG: hypothetical protein AAF206_09675 [Bacteroidota bacterium]
MGSTIFLGQTPLHQPEAAISGEYVSLHDQRFYRITNYDAMRPFFMSLVSHSDHWLFISSTGGLTAGRKNQQNALFPYYTDDKLAASAEHTGSKSIFLLEKDLKTYLWEPFSQSYRSLYSINRNLYKNQTGNILLFEEVNHDLGLQFRYSWQFSEAFGIVRHAELTNLAEESRNVRILDGIQNVLPYGIQPVMQDVRSNLSHAYKKNELDATSGLAMFMLSAMIVDKAEPSEALRATTIWSHGLSVEHHLLSSRQLNQFRKGEAVRTEVDVRAEPGSYLVGSHLELAAGTSTDWYIVSEINQDHAAVEALKKQLSTDPAGLRRDLEADLARDTARLRQLVGMADGLQCTGDELMVGRHYANVLFNIMRGGIFEDQYAVEKDDLLEYVRTIRPGLLTEEASFFEGLNEQFAYQDLIQTAEASQDANLIRIAYEYLPLSFSRRHGDPSRPWNQFSIETRNADGSKSRYYQGNWRDIFQNWEALAISFPAFINGMITKFVNASTIDGYNPYRITRDGIDWEVIEPDDPWSFIGYWGDHQIIYLLKLLEVSAQHNRDALETLVAARQFVYANVPYRIKSYQDIRKDPQDTIDFDEAVQQEIESRCARLGADGKLMHSPAGDIVRASLAEKMLLTLLTKLSNFVPEAGIWLNTQRPEWNDANNALVGNGVSMVTLYYMRRYISFCENFFGQLSPAQFPFNAAVVDLLSGISQSFAKWGEKTESGFSDQERNAMMNELGRLGESYRKQAYQGFDGQEKMVSKADLADLFQHAQKLLDHAIRLNQREDGLYHAYNLITIEEDTVSLSYLYEMLEGQVAVLSSGLLNAEESLAVLDALKQSAMYREDQYSYLLYPNRQLSRFLDKNCLPCDFVQQSPLAQALLQAGDERLLSEDVNGEFHFCGDFHNAQDLQAALDQLKEGEFAALAAAEATAYLQVFEEMFNHKAFTGRSGTFFGYEGLGSIYWHMVSKLLLATQEIIYAHPNASESVRGRLIDHYYEIRAGIGINKSPELYGAFPTDPYSHTPAHKGAQQPGMTGQVKEDVINRWAELGVQVSDGKLSFAPTFLSPSEFLTQAESFSYLNQSGQMEAMQLATGELGFTYCQVPVVYRQAESNQILLHRTDGTTDVVEGLELNRTDSARIFGRDGQVSLLVVELGG